MPTPRDLELSGDEVRSMVAQAMDRIVDHLEHLDDVPADGTDGAEAVAARFVEPIPKDPTPFEELLADLFDEAIPASLAANSGRYMAYVPGGGLFHAAAADLIGDAVNRYVGTPFAAPVLTRIEATVVDWFADVVGYPESAGGVLTSGGSIANQTALVAAREDRAPDDLREATLYASDQVHGSVAKAAKLAGIPPGNVRTVATDDGYRLDVDALADRIDRDRDAGRTPFLVVASAGTTNTGAVDPLDAVADLCDAEDLWYHVDGAYGGFFALTDEGGRSLAGIERSDSVTLDPHKTLFLPYGTGSVLVRDEGTLVRAHGVDADYIPEDERGIVPGLHRRGPELSRPFRGLRVWLPVKMHGVGAFREALSEKIHLARRAAKEVAGIDDVDVVAEPQLSTFAFRFAPPGLSGEAVDAANRRLLDRINASGRVHLSGTVLDDVFAVRVCVVSFRTHRDHVAAAVETIRDAVDEVRAGI